MQRLEREFFDDPGPVTKASLAAHRKRHNELVQSLQARYREQLAERERAEAAELVRRGPRLALRHADV